MRGSAKARAAAVTTDPRWHALVTRDPKAGNAFVYSVKTTGVYCRPACPSRLAKPEHISFHDTPSDAERAGFRPCKRCKPEGRSVVENNAETVSRICRFIDSSGQAPTLDELSRYAGWSTYHLHRTFKAMTGLTPRAYARARRAERIRSELGRGVPVTRALYEAGYGSSSRFYEEADQVMGMTPTAFRAGGINMVIRFAVGKSSLGNVLVAQSERGVCAILMGDDPGALVRDLKKRFPAADLIPGNASFRRLIATVVNFIESPKKNFSLPLDIRGTVFQKRVWDALRKVRPGETVSYSELAGRIRAPRAARAVARACAANPLAVAIPCHRAAAKDGSLSGYRWGVHRKRALLERESR